MIFGFNKKKPIKDLLRADEFNSEKGWRVRFQLMSEELPNPLHEWEKSTHKGCIWLLNILNMDDKDVIHKTETSIDLPFSFLMNELTGQEGYLQKILNLPAIFDGGIHLESHGLLHHNEYKLSYKWINGSGRTMALPDFVG